MIKRILLTSIAVLLIGASAQLYAQAPCATLNVNLISGTLNQPCDTNVTVSFTVQADVNTNFAVNETDTYAVNSIPYVPYPWVGANTFVVTTDDTWSQLYPIPFDFCFFGQTYNQFVIGSNGQISFDPSRAGLGNAWATSGQIAPFNDPDMNNTIMGCYHDIDFNVGGSVTWDTIGVAPCRKLIINWTSVPMFSCNSMIDSQQVVLHEFTNLIEVNLGAKPVCATWNSGVAHQGIQNAAATTAFMVPGRNGTVWGPVNNDSWEFNPAGDPYTFTKDYFWYNGATNALIDTGVNLSLTSPYPPFIVCRARIIGGCSNDTTWATDTLNMLPGKVNADFEFEPRLGCDQDTVIFTNTSVPGAPAGTNFFWNFGNGSFSAQTDPVEIYGVQNVYNVTLFAAHPDCEGDTITKSINLNHPIEAVFSVAPDSVCLGQAVVISNISVPNFALLDNFWDFGDGTTTTNNSAVFSHFYQNPGNYTIKLVVTDTLGCQDSMSVNIFVDEPPYLEMSASPTEICLGSPVYFVDSAAPNTIATQYNFDDGNIISNKHNPTHVFQSAGTYNVTYTGFYAVCPDSVITQTITVNDYPLINLGEDVEFCPGLTDAVTLNNTLNASQILKWSDGSEGPSLTVSDPGYYWAQSTNATCTSSDSIWVKRDCYLNIPNAFSPDGDGTNDYFLPRQLLSSGVTEFSMKIFNRWGETIFTTDRIDGRGWDGKYGGKDQPMGTFVYLIEAKWRNGFKNSFQGNVTLVR